MTEHTRVRLQARPVCKLEQQTAAAGRYDWHMAIERDRLEEQQTRLDAMTAEFRAARQRRLEKQGIAECNRGLKRSPSIEPQVPPAKLN